MHAMEAVYDIIIAGGGCAGLSLAYQLSKTNWVNDKRVLIVDRERKTENDRTWSFWTKGNSTPFDHLAYRSWHKLAFRSDGFSDLINLNDWRYLMIRGVDFYEEVYKTIENHPSFRFEYGSIEGITQTEAYAQLSVNGKKYRSNFLFNSIFQAAKWQEKQANKHYIWQHFKGWVIKTEQAIFNPEEPTLFDLRMPQEGECRFMYILPFSENEALVEYTVFGTQLYEDITYEDKLKNYIAQVFKLSDYDILEVESGVIPMTDHQFTRRIGKRIVNIGTIGGQCKPSSGYAFLNIQKDSKQIVDQLVHSNQVLHLNEQSRTFKYFDRLLLNILDQEGDKIKPIFEQLFKNNDIDLLFRFLREETNGLENLKIMWSVPSTPFLKSVFRTFSFFRVKVANY